MLAFGYLALNAATLVGIYLIGSTAIGRSQPDPARARKLRGILIASLLAWQAYLAALGWSGFVQDFSLPPRFVIFMILPAFTFTGVFIAWQRSRAWVRAIPAHWLLYFQTFRVLIEGLFVVSVSQGILHREVTIEGYNFDMIYAGLTPLVTYAVFQRGWLPRYAAIVWNGVGLTVIASIIALFMTTTFFPSVWGASAPLTPIAFGAYPYVLVAGFLMPSAVFMHVLSLAQLTLPQSDSNASDPKADIVPA